MRFGSLSVSRLIVAGRAALALSAVVSVGLWTVPASVATAEEASPMAAGPGYVIAFGDSQRGKALFTGKGCVVCHSINGVGGKAGPALDADPSQPQLDVFDFAARMWRGASTMIVLQEMELGYQIDLTGQELADLARFIHDAEAQRQFSETDVPELIRDWMVDEVYDELDIENMAQ
jgi:cytochrome c